MKSAILCVAIFVAITVGSRSAYSQPRPGVVQPRRVPAQSRPAAPLTRGQFGGQFVVSYKMYGGQRRVFQNRSLASNYANYLKGLGADAKVHTLGREYIVAWRMLGSRSKRFANYKLAQFFQARLRTLGFHAQIARR